MVLFVRRRRHSIYNLFSIWFWRLIFLSINFFCCFLSRLCLLMKRSLNLTSYSVLQKNCSTLFWYLTIGWWVITSLITISIFWSILLSWRTFYLKSMILVCLKVFRGSWRRWVQSVSCLWIVWGCIRWCCSCWRRIHTWWCRCRTKSSFQRGWNKFTSLVFSLFTALSSNAVKIKSQCRISFLCCCSTRIVFNSGS